MFVLRHRGTLYKGSYKSYTWWVKICPRRSMSCHLAAILLYVKRMNKNCCFYLWAPARSAKGEWAVRAVRSRRPLADFHKKGLLVWVQRQAQKIDLAFRSATLSTDLRNIYGGPTSEEEVREAPDTWMMKFATGHTRQRGCSEIKQVWQVNQHVWSSDLQTCCDLE